MTTFVIFLLHLILNLQINENKKYFYSHQLIHNKTVIICLEYVICSLTEHGIVLSQAEQFDVLDLYKTHIVKLRVRTRLMHMQAFSRLLMKGIFDSDVLRPFDKKLIS